MTRRYPAILVLLPVLIAGCGGLGGSGHKATSGDERVGPRVTIAWPAQTRDFAAPTFATAARIVFPNAGANNTDAAQVVTRPAGTAAVQQTVLLDFAVSPGNHLVRAEFLADASSNTPLATASLNLNVGRDGVLRTLDGKPLGTVAYTSKVTGLTLSTAQDVEVGTTSEVVVTATTETGVTALPLNAVTLAATSGANLVTINSDGTVTGVAEGTATLVPSIEGLTGTPTAVTVLPAPIAAHVVDLVTNDIVFDADRNRILAAVPATATNGNSVQSIDVATGALGTIVPVGSDPSVLALSDDGSRLYVGLRGASRIRPVDLATDTAGAAFDIPYPGGSAYAFDIAVQPGSTSTIAVLAADSTTGRTFGPMVFDNGVHRTNDGGFSTGDRLYWRSPSALDAYVSSSFGSDYTYSVDAQGVTQTGYNAFTFGSPTALVRIGSRTYNRAGQVYDAATLTLIGTFPLTASDSNPSFFGPAVDPVAKRAYFVEFGFGTARLHVFDTDTFVQVASRRISIPNVPTSVPNLVKDIKLTQVDANHLAFRLHDRVIFLDIAGL